MSTKPFCPHFVHVKKSCGQKHEKPLYINKKLRGQICGQNYRECQHSEMLAFFPFANILVKGENIMVNVRKRGKSYEYRFEIASVDGTRKWITKSGFQTKAEAFKEGAKAYNDFHYNGKRVQLNENMSYSDFLDYWIDNYANFNLHYSTTMSYLNIIKNHVKPKIGIYKLGQLDVRILQEFINIKFIL